MAEHDFEEILDTDAFLDALAAGEDPSRGDDELAGLLLGMREEVYAPLPPTPRVEELLGDDKVIDITAKRRKRISGWSHALVGAAAATVLIAGAGTAIYNAHPGSPLWGLNESLFSEHAAVVQLASTLDEMDERSNNGDVQGALQLLDQAKAIVGSIADNSKVPEQAPVTVTETVTTTAQAPAPESQAPASRPAEQRPQSAQPESNTASTTARQSAENAAPSTIAQTAPEAETGASGGIGAGSGAGVGDGNDAPQVNPQGGQQGQQPANQQQTEPVKPEDLQHKEQQPAGRVGDTAPIGGSTEGPGGAASAGGERR
ncbi:MAG: hypothetical protein Q3962_07575 [Corynebacterium sp.]|nr:hypothetical protein [Corynebacterium sp.]